MADIEIRLGGRTYRMRPEYGAMREIEAAAKNSVATLLRCLAAYEMTAEEMALVVTQGVNCGLPPGEVPLVDEHVGKRLFEAGIGTAAVRGPVADYLIELLYAPDEYRKKAAGEWFAEMEATTSSIFWPSPMQSDGGRQSSGEPLPESSGESSGPSTKNPSASVPPSGSAAGPDRG